jgi:hypothetical protein
MIYVLRQWSLTWVLDLPAGRQVLNPVSGFCIRESNGSQCKIKMLQSYLMKKDVFNAVQRVHQVFRDKGLTLSTAESCTGGSISHYLTALPGASAFFRGGVVAYSEEFKKTGL